MYLLAATFTKVTISLARRILQRVHKASSILTMRVIRLFATTLDAQYVSYLVGNDMLWTPYGARVNNYYLTKPRFIPGNRYPRENRAQHFERVVVLLSEYPVASAESGQSLYPHLFVAKLLHQHL